MKTASTSSRGLVLLLLASCITGCASGGRTGGSFVKVPSHKKKDPASTELKLAAAKVLMRGENYSEARKMYKEILEKDPDSVHAVIGIAQLDQLAMREEEAEKGYRRALDMAPKNPQVMSVVAEYYASIENYELAAQLYERAIDLDPDQKSYHYQMGVILTRQGKVNESLPHFTQSVGAGAAHYNVGRILYDQKRYAESEQHFLKAIDKDPKLAEAQQWLREVRRSRDGELAARSSSPMNQSPSSHQPLGGSNLPPTARSPIAQTPVAQTSVAQTSGSFPNQATQQLVASGNSTQIVPGGGPIVTSSPATHITPATSTVTQPQINPHVPAGNTPVGTAPAGSVPTAPAGQAAANTPAQVPVDPALQTTPSAPGALSPAQLEQMRNQQLRSQAQGPAGNPAWSSPRAY